MRLRAFRNRSGDCSRGAVGRRTSASNARCGPGSRASRKSTFASAVLLAFPFGENYAGVPYLKVELGEPRAIVSHPRVVGEARADAKLDGTSRNNGATQPSIFDVKQTPTSHGSSPTATPPFQNLQIQARRRDPWRHDSWQSR